jgi:predicted RNA-binding Zn ribbon-like protein
MANVRRETIRVGENLAVEFANTVQGPPGGTASLAAWSDLVDFLELRGAVARAEGDALRAMAERDARRCAAAVGQAVRLRETIRAMLDAIAARRALRAAWVAEVNQALAWGTGASRLARQRSGWRLDFSPAVDDPLRALAPIARAMADLATSPAGAQIKRCANPRCVLYFRDTSRTRRRRWCSMAVCGNRMKVAAHLRRHGRPRSA